MDLNANEKLIEGQNDSIGEAKDRISELPDPILHYILSFIETKFVARTSLISQRWNQIWTSIPILVFPSWTDSETPSEIIKFMDFVDRTLILHDGSSTFQKVYLETHTDMNASRVHSWITYITKRKVQDLNLYLHLDKPFFIPSSLFKCESLTKLELSASCDTHIPKSFSFPKLKSLELSGIQFTEDDGWSAQQFSNCPVLEYLILENCTWFGMRKVCILAPALEVLKIQNDFSVEDGLQSYVLKIYAPNLVSMHYFDGVAKDYDLCSFVKLDSAEIYFIEDDVEQSIDHGAAVSKFLQAISHVRSLQLDTSGLEAILVADDIINILPTFHNLNKLDLQLGPARDELIFALLKAAPNLKRLRFDRGVFLSDDDDIVYDATEDLFQHLQSVGFTRFGGMARELRWAKLILKNAKSLQTMSFSHGTYNEVVISELSSLARASGRCVVKFGKNLW